MKKHIPAAESLILQVKDYTHSISGLIDHLQEAFPEKTPDENNPRKNYLYISDVVDELGRQCVDLVQEGGGVHGIALAGYTYVLEKMGITFSKMAGTSAGAINTMLLGATLNRDEVEWLQSRPINPAWHSNYAFDKLNKDDFSSTRSEKLLEYLSGKDLSDLVDGHPAWRKILLKLFMGRVKLEAVSSEKKRLKWLGMGACLSLLILMCSSLALAISPASAMYNWWRVLITGSIISWVVLMALILARVIQARLLWLLSGKMGVNPGTDFYEWVKKKLEENKVNTIDSLREKMEMETIWFGESYHVPQNADAGLEKHDYTIEMTDADETNASFGKELTFISGRLTTLETAASNGNDIQREADELWDRLMRDANNLPAGDEVKEVVATARATQLLTLFTRIIKLQDISCGYNVTTKNRNAGSMPTTGPYTREMTIITTDITNEIKVEFPAMHKLYWGTKYDISPASYVRASMAIPFFFTPFKVHVTDDQRAEMEEAWQEFMKIEKRHNPQATWQADNDATLFVDGGAISNFPINIYATPEMPVPRKPTIGIQLEYEDETLSNTINTTLGEVGSIISTVRYYYDRDFIAKHDMYKRTVRAIDTGQIHWLNFNMQNKDKMELFFRGALAATIFLSCTHKDFDKHHTSWIPKLMQLAAEVPCPAGMQGAIRSKNCFSIYGKADEQLFRNADMENPHIRFSWPEYKRERLLALSRLKHQRNILKTFPK
ncbi:MAG: patatin-like phospholipase family protein [Chitinophagaceae bacterium]